MLSKQERKEYEEEIIAALTEENEKIIISKMFGHDFFRLKLTDVLFIIKYKILRLFNQIVEINVDLNKCFKLFLLLGKSNKIVGAIIIIEPMECASCSCLFRKK